MIADTLAFSRRLIGGGFTQQQAETLAAAQAEMFNSEVASKEDVRVLAARLDTLATRADLFEMKAELLQALGATNSNLQGVKGELIKSMGDMKAELIKWSIAQTFAVGALVAAIVKFLH